MRIFRTRQFSEWIKELKDRAGWAAINRRIVRMEEGNAGNIRSVGSGVLEMKIDFGPGYRVYYIQHGDIAVILLCGGDKSSQSRDIERAKDLAKKQEVNDIWNSI